MNKITVCFLFIVILLSGCADTKSHSKSVYMLMDTSGTYTQQLNHARTIINYLLGKLNSGDSLAVARIDSGSFSEKDLIAKMTFDQRPSVANTQKLHFKQTMDNFVKNVTQSSHTDITGVLLSRAGFFQILNGL